MILSLYGDFDRNTIVLKKLNWSQIQSTDGIDMYVIGLSAPHEVPTADVSYAKKDVHESILRRWLKGK